VWYVRAYAGVRACMVRVRVCLCERERVCCIFRYFVLRRQCVQFQDVEVHALMWWSCTTLGDNQSSDMGVGVGVRWRRLLDVAEQLPHAHLRHLCSPNRRRRCHASRRLRLGKPAARQARGGQAVFECRRPRAESLGGGGGGGPRSAQGGCQLLVAAPGRGREKAGKVP
jgi:hypothetical protein